MKPFASIIIPTYNRAKFLQERALKSAFGQTDQDFEVIVVDDGSTDNTKDELRSLVEKGEIEYIFQKNQGVSSARNAGVKEAQGEIIIFLDSDDELKPRYVEAAKKVFTDKEVGLMIPRFILRDERGKSSYIDFSSKPIWLTGIGGGKSLRREIFTKENLWFDEGLRNFEDTDFGIRVINRCKVKHLGEPLYIYNFILNVYAGTSLSSDSNLVKDFEIFREKDYKFYENFGKEAFAYLHFWAGTIYSNYSIRKANKAFVKSLGIKWSFRTLVYLLMSLPHSKTFYRFLDKILIFLRRTYKTIKHSI